MGTGDLTEAEAKTAGLVKRHAYGVLQVRSVRGLKLLQLKNPWSEVRWKGNYSAQDTTNWTPELKRELNYDPAQAQQVDNGISSSHTHTHTLSLLGVFWIDWAAVRRFYEVLYINWKPDLFPFKYTLHE